MTRQSEKVLEDALHLSPLERAEVVERLLSSFEFSERNAIDELWAKEAESRLDAYERGEIGAIPAKDVFDKIEKQKG
jgi:putative addiction module component (TIGR02574 family)